MKISSQKSWKLGTIKLKHMKGNEAATQNVDRYITTVIGWTLFLKYAKIVYETLANSEHMNAENMGNISVLNAGFTTNAAPRNAITKAGGCIFAIFSFKNRKAIWLSKKGTACS